MGEGNTSEVKGGKKVTGRDRSMGESLLAARGSPKEREQNTAINGRNLGPKRNHLDSTRRRNSIFSTFRRLSLRMGSKGNA